MKVLVTGGAGFIGSFVARSLIERGDQVVLIDNFNDYYTPKLKRDRLKGVLGSLKYKLYEGNVQDLEFCESVFKKEAPNKVIHLAAMAGVRSSLKNPLLYEEVNIRGTNVLLEMAVKYGVENFIYASSSSVYGNNKKVPFSESDRVDTPISPYAATKRATELIAHTYSHIHKLNTTGLRFFTVYGPWGRPDMAYFLFADKILRGETIDVYNFGKMTRNFTYIDDIVAGVLTVLDANLQYEVMNIGGDREETLLRFIEVIEKNLGKKADKNLMQIQPGDVPSTVADISKLRKLGWEPKTRIEKGLKNFIDWYKEYYKV